MADLRILEVRPDFSEHFDNVPDFEVRVSRRPKFGPYDVRHQLYLAHEGPLVTFFTWAGKPDGGFGGWKRTVCLKSGGSLEVIGGWSSNTSSASSVYPEFRCVPACYRVGRKDGVGMSCGLLIEPLVDWFLDNRLKLAWGLYLFDTDSGPRVVPSMGRFTKPMSGQRQRARLLPPSANSSYGFKPRPLDPKQRADHRAYFLDAVAVAYGKVTAKVDPLDTHQLAAVSA